MGRHMVLGGYLAGEIGRLWGLTSMKTLKVMVNVRPPDEQGCFSDGMCAGGMFAGGRCACGMCGCGMFADRLCAGGRGALP